MDRICGVIDFDGFDVRSLGEFLVREFGFVSTRWRNGRSYRYNLSQYGSNLTPRDWRTVRHVENHIFGVRFYPLRGETVYSVEELDDHLQEFYDNCKTSYRNVIAYKGGHYEKDRLDSLRIPSVDLESFGCPRFNDLQCERYDRLSCGYHIRDDLHCPRAEVTAFKDWVWDNI